MTTIVVRDGWIAADSRETVEGEGGDYCRPCEKIFEVGSQATLHSWALVGLSGESSPGMLFLEWLRTNDPEIRDQLRESDADFTALVCDCDGRVFEYDAWCVPTEIKTPYHATGSGSKYAYGALDMGASAEQACLLASKRDPHTAPPIVVHQFHKPTNPVHSSENI